MATGQDIVRLAMEHVGEEYILGAPVPLGNRNWHGPWDCAEFVSWCTYHAYGRVFAVRPPNINRGESYSGWWYEDAMASDFDIPVADAIRTPGAILIRKPGAFGIAIGHVSISRGDGTTVEAHSRAVGVAVRQGAASRQWSVGMRFADVTYDAVGAVPAYREPRGLLMLRKPYMEGDAVLAVQRALAGKGIDPGDIDGSFGPLTNTAVAAFQAREGLLVDGVVGRDTANALGLGWPIAT